MLTGLGKFLHTDSPNGNGWTFLLSRERKERRPTQFLKRRSVERPVGTELDTRVFAVQNSGVLIVLIPEIDE